MKNKFDAITLYFKYLNDAEYLKNKELIEEKKNLIKEYNKAIFENNREISILVERNKEIHLSYAGHTKNLSSMTENRDLSKFPKSLR